LYWVTLRRFTPVIFFENTSSHSLVLLPSELDRCCGHSSTSSSYWVTLRRFTLVARNLLRMRNAPRSSRLCLLSDDRKNSQTSGVILHYSTCWISSTARRKTTSIRPLTSIVIHIRHFRSQNAPRNSRLLQYNVFSFSTTYLLTRF